MVNIFTGSYTTRRDDVRTYAYSAIWTRRGDAVVWKAKVRKDNELVSAPDGRIDHPPEDGDIPPLLRILIEGRIEQLMGMH
jgi:hypothetical protein